MSPLRIGLLGLGRAGHFHLQSLRLTELAVVQRVYDLDLRRTEETARRFHCQVARTAEEAIEGGDVDAVIVATPTDLHFEYVQRGLRASKPVLTEKPLGRHLHEIDRCFELAASQRTPLFVAFQRRFDPSFAALVQGVRSGRIGDLQFVRSVSRDNPVPAADYIRTSGGIFQDCMVHDLDMIFHIVGEIPTHVSSFGTSFLPEIGNLGDLDSVVASMIFPSGITASIDINRKSVYGYDQRIEAFGNGGMLQADNWHQTSVVSATKATIERPPIDYSFPTRYRDAYLAELECFVRCARGEQEVPITHRDVRVNHMLASALETAAKERRVVPLEPESLAPTS